MKNSLSSLLTEEYKTIQIFGLPGTYKTTFLLQIIRKKLTEGKKRIYLIDNNGNFPIIRLESIKWLLQHLVVFQPKTLKEEAFLLDDLCFQFLSQDSILLIDDVFRHINLEKQKTSHLNSYILAVIKTISKEVKFPVIITNQARSYDNNVRPFLQNLTLQYFDNHLLFEKSQNVNRILVSFFDRDQYIFQEELEINSSGFFIEL